MLLFFNEITDLQRTDVSKVDSGTGVFLCVFRISSDHPSFRTPPNDCFCIIIHVVDCLTQSFDWFSYSPILIFKNDITHIFSGRLRIRVSSIF